MKLLNNHEQWASNFIFSPKINPEFLFIKLIIGYRVILLCAPFSHWFYQDFCNNYENFSLIFFVVDRAARRDKRDEKRAGALQEQEEHNQGRTEREPGTCKYDANLPC